MPNQPHLQTGNQLLDAVSSADLETLTPHLEWVDHGLRDVVVEPRETMNFAYFPVSGLFSVVATIDRNDQVEAGMIGREGFLGASIMLRAEANPFRVITQAQGRSLRISSEALLEATESLPGFRVLLLRYIHTMMIQLSSTILANSSYTIPERLARWILMTHDRVGSNTFPMTHEFMSLMLAVRRPGVTEAVNALEGMHLIRATRGNIQVLDRAGLESMADGIYGQAEQEHRRLIGGQTGMPGK
jgi:CRP-like cAMP-binding protein